MARDSVPFYSLNRGEVSRLALMRVDQEKLRLSAVKQVNVQPLAIGPGTFRAGSAYLGEISGSNKNRLIEFVFASDDTALIELTANKMRVWVDDALVTRASVSATVPAFSSWTKTEATGSTVTLGASLTINNVNPGTLSYANVAVAINAAQRDVEHAIRIVVTKGRVKFRMGSGAGLQDIISEQSLGVGTHSLTFTPNVATVYPQIESNTFYSQVVSSVSIEAAGTLELPTPWGEADLPNIMYDQSADIIYVACSGYQQYKIERRSTRGWSIVKYRSDNGPFPIDQGDDSIGLTVSTRIGDITITSTRNLFRTAHVGALMRLFFSGQVNYVQLSTEATFGESIRVSGVNKNGSGTATVDRTFSVNIAGTWSGTLTLQRSFDSADSGFVDFQTFTGNGTTVINDDLNNIIVWYRIGFKSGGYTSGEAEAQLSYNGGGGAGIARITGYTSPTQVSAEVLEPLIGIRTNNWRFGEWNDIDGWPTGVALAEGRLWWAGQSKVWGSDSDAFESFDFEAEGDAAPISRSIGRGPIASIKWMLPLSRLCLGADMGVVTARSSSFDEPLTPTAFSLKYSTTQGAKKLRPLAVDTKGVYVEKSGRRVYMLVFSSQDFDYRSIDLTRLNPDIGLPGFKDAAIQRQPDTVLRFPLNDGKMACLLYDEDDEVDAWWRVETDGAIEQVAVLPGEIEDQVYISVARTIGGVTKRYLERFSRLDECQGGTLCKLMDSHIVYSGAATTTITGLGHLNGKSVVAWGDGAEIGFNVASPAGIATYTVSGGQITLPVAVTNAVVGLPYTGSFISAKLAYASASSTAINKMKRINAIGMVLDKTHYQGVRFGHYKEAPARSALRSLPLVENGKETASGYVWPSYDQETIPFDGDFNTDDRLQIEMRSPRPATVLGFTLDIKTAG